jgi:hypothetical protein
MGLVIGGISFLRTIDFTGHEYDITCDATPLLCILTYYIATSAFPYGEKSWLNRFMSQGVKWLFYGAIFGLASVPAIGLVLGLVQAVIGAVSFFCLMAASNWGIPDKDRCGVQYLDHKYVEIVFGFMGTLMFFFAR